MPARAYVAVGTAGTLTIGLWGGLLPTVKRLEARPGIHEPRIGHTVTALRRALEAAGVEFIDENGD